VAATRTTRRTTPVPAIAAGTVHATKVYGHDETTVTAIDDVTVGFPEGRFTAIMGASGSGKSTLLHCTAGLDALTSGQVFIEGVDLGSLSERKLTKLRRSRVGFVFQAFNLVPTLTALENMTLPLALAGRDPDPDWLDYVVDTVGLKSRLGRRPAELSGGQQQRVAVARALVSRPAIIFADEPTGNLDSGSSAEILAFMRTAVDDLRQTIVMVTHDPGAAAHAHHVLFLADGRIVGEIPQSSPAAVLDRIKDLDRA